MEMQYIRVGDYFIPDLELPEETRPIGKWGRMHRDYLREHKPIQYNCLLLSGKLWTYLADLNEQAQDRLERIIEQMKTDEGISEALKASDPMAWVGAMNNIRNRAEEIILQELIYGEDATCEFLKNFGTAISNQQNMTHAPVWNTRKPFN